MYWVFIDCALAFKPGSGCMMWIRSLHKALGSRWLPVAHPSCANKQGKHFIQTKKKPRLVQELHSGAWYPPQQWHVLFLLLIRKRVLYFGVNNTFGLLNSWECNCFLKWLHEPVHDLSFCLFLCKEDLPKRTSVLYEREPFCAKTTIDCCYRSGIVLRGE